MFTFLPTWLKRTSRLLPVLLLPLAAHAQAPVNDDPSGAIFLPLAAACTPTSATNAGATTSGATNTTGGTSLGYTNPGCGAAINPKDVWFAFTTAAASQLGSTGVSITVAGSVAGQVRVFSGGASGPFTQVGCAAAANNTQAPTLYATGLAAATTYYVSVSGYGSNDAPGAFTICVTPTPANDVAVDAVQTLTQLPTPAGTPHLAKAVVSNRGLNAQTNVAVTLTVTGPNGFTFTNTQTVAALASGASATVSFAGYSPTNMGTQLLTVSVGPDDLAANNSRSATQVVNGSTYSYAEPGGATGTGSVGIGSSLPGHAFVCRYSINSPVSVTQVRSYLVNTGGLPSGPTSTIGKTVYGVVLDVASGALLARSADHVVSAGDINTYVALPLTALVSIPAGTDVYVGMVQVYPGGQTDTYYPFGTPLDEQRRAGAFYWFNTIAGTIRSDLGLTSNSRYRLMIEAVTAPATPCAPVTALAAGSLTPGSAVLTFTGAPAIITYTASDGTATTVPAPSSPTTLTGLLPGTAYTVAVSANCGANTSLPTSVTFTTPPAVAPYAPLPFAESFEGPWLSVAAVRDAPTANWRNTPPTGDLAWRREDDGASANWTSSTGGYGASSQGIHTARFHSAAGGTIGSPTTGALDLYVDLSAPGNKTLTFDYINADGTDVLRLYESTDGGATFRIVPAAASVVSPTFTAKTATLTSTSATTVIRFQATKDFGTSDIGIDNVRIGVVTATRNEALAAAVGLYPNPARNAFTVTVPAGPLGAATATLHNGLGQVVRTRPLGLPAAGGTAEFDVRGLAPGVYTLQLLSGETLVVKRVVLE